jgi:hypothetical protein
MLGPIVRHATLIIMCIQHVPFVLVHRHVRMVVTVTRLVDVYVIPITMAHHVINVLLIIIPILLVHVSSLMTTIRIRLMKIMYHLCMY